MRFSFFLNSNKLFKIWNELSSFSSIRVIDSLSTFECHLRCSCAIRLVDNVRVWEERTVDNVGVRMPADCFFHRQDVWYILDYFLCTDEFVSSTATCFNTKIVVDRFSTSCGSFHIFQRSTWSCPWFEQNNHTFFSLFKNEVIWSS